jgi:hypothetical protein
LRDFPKGATVQVVTSEGMLGRNGTIKSMRFQQLQRQDCFVGARGVLNNVDDSGEWYMCSSYLAYPYSSLTKPSACAVFSDEPTNRTAKYFCFAATAHSEPGGRGVTLDTRIFYLNISGALGPSYVYYTVQFAPRLISAHRSLRCLVWFCPKPKREETRMDQSSINGFDRGQLRRINLQLIPARDGWIPASALINYDNGSMVRLENEPPFMIFSDSNKKKGFFFTPSVGAHTITATLYSEPNGKGDSVNHTVSFRVWGDD